jgi:hypothetical protein
MIRKLSFVSEKNKRYKSGDAPSDTSDEEMLTRWLSWKERESEVSGSVRSRASSHRMDEIAAAAARYRCLCTTSISHKFCNIGTLSDAPFSDTNTDAC